MYSLYSLYLLFIFCGISGVIAQDVPSEPQQPLAKQQPTTWSQLKRWGLYITSAGAVLLGSYAIYKTTVGKKASVIPSTPALSLLVQFHDELDQVKSFKVLDEKVKEFVKKDEKHKEFAESTQGKLIYKLVKSRIEKNIKQAQELVQVLNLPIPKPNKYEPDPTYNTERYLNQCLVYVLEGTKGKGRKNEGYEKLTQQHIDAFSKILDLGANAKTASDGEISILKAAFWKYHYDKEHKAEQLPYDREIIKTLILNNAIKPEGTSLSGHIADVMEKDPELKEFFKEQGYSNDGVKYKSWWK